MAQGRKKRQTQRATPDPASNGPDDVAETPFGYMARWGRFISVQGTLSPEEHAEAVAAILETGPDIRRDQEARRARLLEVLQEADAVDLLARASLTYLNIDYDNFKEWESDRSPAHIEYLALQVLGTGQLAAKDVNPMRQAELTDEAIDIIREMFRAASTLMVSESVEARQRDPNNPIPEYALKARLESLAIRSAGYQEHLEQVLHGCLDPFDEECRRLLGFTAGDALALTQALGEVVSSRVAPLAEEAAESYANMLRQVKRERRHPRRADRQVPDWLLKLPPSEAKRRVGLLVSVSLFSGSRSFAVVTADDLASSSGIERAVCEAFLQAFACPPELFQSEHHAYPGGAHPLTVQPFIDVGDGFLAAAPSSITDAIRPRMEDLLARTSVWDRYADARGKYLEREATERLAAALPGSLSWVGLQWRSTTDSSDLDGLVSADDLAIRLQCKAGRLTAPARRGAPGRIRRDLDDLIRSAADQHKALATAIASEGAPALGFSSDQSRTFNVPLQFEAIICIDDVTVWATQAHELRSLDALPSDRHVPWILSLTDLMAVTDLLQGAELAHYLVRRQRIERDGRMEAHDELDWVGHYIAEGLFFDPYFSDDDPAQSLRLLSYTEPIDAWYFTRAGVRTTPAPKPSQDLPQNLQALISRLEAERSTHWIIAAISFLDGDQESRDIWDAAVLNARARVPERGWSNASQEFHGRLGVTFYVDIRLGRLQIVEQVTSYCRKKIEETGTPNWIAVGEGASGGLFVIAMEQEASKRLADVFLEPPAHSPDPGRPGSAG